MAFVSKVAPFESGHPTLTSCHTERSQSSSLVSRRPLVKDFINPSNQKNKFFKNSARQMQFSAYISRAALQTFYVSKPCIFSIHIGTGLRACPTAKTLLQQFSILPHASIFFSLPRIKGSSSGGNRVSPRSPRFCFERSRDRDTLCSASHFRVCSLRHGSQPLRLCSERVQSSDTAPCCLWRRYGDLLHPSHHRARLARRTFFAAVGRQHLRKSDVRRHSSEVQVHRHVARAELREVLPHAPHARRGRHRREQQPPERSGLCIRRRA